VIDIKTLLKYTKDVGASDLHLTGNSRPIVRVNGDLRQIMEYEQLDRDSIKNLIYTILTNMQKEKFEKEKELDFSFAVQGFDRYRVNVHMQRGFVEAAFRRIPDNVPEFVSLNLPAVVADLARRPSGLVLVTGPTGSGKSTTMASMINLINTEMEKVIISIEDPIEFVHKNRRCIIKQREVYSDTFSFSEALRRALRQDPDVIVVGEMRDLETIGTALTAAETGHLVLATLHTPDAPQTVERIIDVFSPHQQKQVRLQLADCLQGVISQTLLPKVDGTGRVLATEIMVTTPAVRNLIREGNVSQLPTLIQTGSQYGMYTMDKCLKRLLDTGVVSFDAAMSKVKDVEEFQVL